MNKAHVLKTYFPYRLGDAVKRNDYFCVIYHHLLYHNLLAGRYLRQTSAINDIVILKQIVDDKEPTLRANPNAIYVHIRAGDKLDSEWAIRNLPVTGFIIFFKKNKL